MIRPLAFLVVLGLSAASYPARASESPDDAVLREIARRLLLDIDKVEDRDERTYDLQRTASLFAIVGDRDQAIKTWDRAIALVESVTLDKTRYNNHLLTWISRAQIERSEPKAALATLEKALAIARSSPADSARVYMLREIARQQETARDASGAKATLVEIERLREEIADPSLARERQVKPLREKLQAGDLKGAIRYVLDEKTPDGVNADGDRANKLGMIAYAAGPKDLEELAEIISLIRAINGSWRHQTLSVIVPVQIRIGRLSDAFETALSMDPALDFDVDNGRLRRIRSLVEVARAQGKAKDRAGLDRTMLSVVEDIAALNSPDQKSYEYAQVAGVWIDLRELAEARRIVDRQPKGQRTDLLIALGCAQQASGRAEESRATFAEALKEEEEAQRKPPELKLPDDPAQAASMKNQIQVARAETLAILHIWLDEMPAALALVEALPASAEKDYCVPRLAVTIASSGHTDIGLAWVGTLVEPKAKVDALLALSAGLLQRREMAAKFAAKRRDDPR